MIFAGKNILIYEEVCLIIICISHVKEWFIFKSSSIITAQATDVIYNSKYSFF